MIDKKEFACAACGAEPGDDAVIVHAADCEVARESGLSTSVSAEYLQACEQESATRNQGHVSSCTEDAVSTGWLRVSLGGNEMLAALHRASRKRVRLLTRDTDDENQLFELDLQVNKQGNWVGSFASDGRLKFTHCLPEGAPHDGGTSALLYKKRVFRLRVDEDKRVLLESSTYRNFCDDVRTELVISDKVEVPAGATFRKA